MAPVQESLSMGPPTRQPNQPGLGYRPSEEALAMMREPPALCEADAREARLLQREIAIKKREQDLRELEEAMCALKAEVNAQPSAPEVARTPKKRARQRGGRLLLMVSLSPRRRNRSPAKSRRSKMLPPTALADNPYGSPRRRSQRSIQSCSTTASLEEPPPQPSPDMSMTGAEQHQGKASLLRSFPLPLAISSWDWPLSREEKKALVLMFDRQELMLQRDEYAEKIQDIKHRCQLLGDLSDPE